MTSNSIIFSAITPLPSHFLPLNTINGSQLALHQKDLLPIPNSPYPLVLYVPHLCMNLISINNPCETGLIITFDSFICSVMDPQSGQTIGRSHKSRRLYYLDSLHVSVSSVL